MCIRCVFFFFANQYDDITHFTIQNLKKKKLFVFWYLLQNIPTSIHLPEKISVPKQIFTQTSKAKQNC